MPAIGGCCIAPQLLASARSLAERGAGVAIHVDGRSRSASGRTGAASRAQ